MSTEDKALPEKGTPTDVTRFDGVRVPATEYRPVWLDSLADDVTLEGSDEEPASCKGPRPSVRS